MTIEQKKISLFANYHSDLKNLIHKSIRISMAYTIANNQSIDYIKDYTRICVYLGVEPEEHGPEKRLSELREFVNALNKYVCGNTLDILLNNVEERLNNIEKRLQCYSLEELQKRSDEIGRIQEEVHDKDNNKSFSKGLTSYEVLSHLHRKPIVRFINTLSFSLL